MVFDQPDSPFLPLREDTFKFACHSGIACFTRCCAGLKLVLTPYDILRMKKALGLSSDEFLDRYATTGFQGSSPLPRVFLRMNLDKTRSCPFVTHEGCGIYADRPGACRIYPLGRAALKLAEGKGAREKYFVVREAHCLGFQEAREWTVKAWLANEGVNEYNEMNDAWLEILTSSKGLGAEETLSRKIQMFFMTSYNLDKFREFVFKSRFFNRFYVPPSLRADLASDDVALMRFSFDWLKFSLYGEKTIKIIPEEVPSAPAIP